MRADEGAGGGTNKAPVDFSVVIPAYNARRHIVETVQSALGQTHGSLEVIVVDDGSTDGTADVLAAIDDPRLRVIVKANEGCSKTRNAGIEAARGEFVAFLDADDRWRPTKLASEAAVLRAYPDVGMVLVNLQRFGSEGLLPRDQFSYSPQIERVTEPSTIDGVRITRREGLTALLALSQPPWHPSGLTIRRQVDTRFRNRLDLVGEDVAFILEVAAGTRVAFVEQPQVEYRLHETNSTGGKASVERVVDGLLALEIVRDQLANPEHRQALDRRMGQDLAGIGHQHFWDRHWGAAAAAYGRSLKYPGARLTSLKHLAALPVMAVWPGHWSRRP